MFQKNDLAQMRSFIGSRIVNVNSAAANAAAASSAAYHGFPPMSSGGGEDDKSRLRTTRALTPAFTAAVRAKVDDLLEKV